MQGEHALAAAAARRGAEVVLVSGPVNLALPFGVRRVDVETSASSTFVTDGVAVDEDRIGDDSGDRTVTAMALAHEMLDEIRLDPSMGTDVMKNADYLRVELHVAAGTEMITKLEDFLRRRSKITQVVAPDDVRNAEGIREVAEILFDDQADARLEEYFGEIPPGASG